MTQTITLLESIPKKLGSTEAFVEKGGVHWLAMNGKSVRALAKAMNELQARFITITAYQLPKEEGFRLEYHWDLDGKLLGFSFQLAAKSIESIFDLCEAVDWIEREIHEEYDLDFTGREYEPLLLRQGDNLGVNLRDGVNVREVMTACDVVAASQETK
jgi:NADH:ubiquinone oxidoreductase subunit C